MTRTAAGSAPDGRPPGKIFRDHSAGPADILSIIRADLMLRMPAIRIMEAQSRNHQHAYLYLFGWKSSAVEGHLGSCHALEIGFVFGNYDDTFCGSGPDANALSWEIQDAWAALRPRWLPHVDLGDCLGYCE